VPTAGGGLAVATRISLVAFTAAGRASAEFFFYFDLFLNYYCKNESMKYFFFKSDPF
jgi:hypothetical protein